MTKEEVIKVLLRDNPGARGADVVMYADCFIDYCEASENITKNGNIVAHPRTGSPIENPYIKVKASAMNQLRKIGRLKNTHALWGV